jgi:hypothetical protein
MRRPFLSSSNNPSTMAIIILLGIAGLYNQRQIIHRGLQNVSVIAAAAAYNRPQLGPTDTNGITLSATPETAASTRNNPKTLLSDNKKENYMRACLVVRNANHLLYEWIAYHYTVLPLRYLIVGYDDTNSTYDMPEDDPTEVLLRWKQLGTDFSYEVWRASDFARNIHYKYDKDLPYFRHLQRQHVFYAKCMQHLQNQSNVGWVALTDIDEYIQINPLDHHLNGKLYDESAFEMNHPQVQQASVFLAPNETLWDRVVARKQLRQRLKLDLSLQNQTGETNHPQPSDHNANSEAVVVPTVLEFLEEYSSQHGGNVSSPCHSFARRRYSAVADENFTMLASSICMPKLDPQIIESMNISHLVTIQFLHHVFPGDWEHNRWAKVLVDLRRISNRSLQRITVLNNPHQPLDECPDAYIPDLVSILRANHYINHWNVHVSRRGTSHLGNATTELKTWAQVAHIRDYQTCDHIHGWLNDFVKQFGMEKAKYLLGYRNS